MRWAELPTGGFQASDVGMTSIKAKTSARFAAAVALAIGLTGPSWGQASVNGGQTAAGQLLARTGLLLEKVLEVGGLDEAGLKELEQPVVDRVMQQRRKLFLGYVASDAPLPRSVFIYEGDEKGTVYLLEISLGSSLTTRGWGPIAVAPQRAQGRAR